MLIAETWMMAQTTRIYLRMCFKGTTLYLEDFKPVFKKMLKLDESIEQMIIHSKIFFLTVTCPREGICEVAIIAKRLVTPKW
jgi:hypothetical protein